MTEPRVVFLGSKRVGLRCLAALSDSVQSALVGAITIDDRADGRTVADQIHAFCASRQLPLICVRNRVEAEAAVREYAPTLCVVCGWYWYIDRALIDSARDGFVGVHFSALPKYRGGSPLVWQIINGESHAAVSLFSFTDEIDGGPVWAQARIQVAPDEYIADVLARLEDETVHLVEEHLPRILEGRIQPVHQDSSQATYCALRQPTDGELQWNAQGRVLYNFVRAQSRPYPGAFTHMNDEKVTVWRARLEDVTYYGSPGQVARITRDGVWVICGDHRPLVLQEVALDDRDMPAHEAIRSTTTRLGRTRL